VFSGSCVLRQGSLAPLFVRTDDVDPFVPRTLYLASADAPKAAVYLTVMKRVLEKGASWLETERARIDGMLTSASVSKPKKAELAVKRNVMSAFKPAAVAAAEEAEL
jgi:hypothetical protein